MNAKGSLATVLSIEKRFWSRVTQLPEDDDGCWLWQGKKDRDGYGIVRANGRDFRAHRVAYMLFWTESIAKDVLIRHLCNTRACCRPDHLRTGTALDNARDRDQSGRGVKRVGEPMLTEFDAMRVLKRYSEGETEAALAVEFGVPRNVIHNLVTRRSHRSLPRIVSKVPREAVDPTRPYSWCKLDAIQVQAVRERHARGEQSAALAKELGVDPKAIRDIVRGRTWKHLLRETLSEAA